MLWSMLSKKQAQILQLGTRMTGQILIKKMQDALSKNKYKQITACTASNKGRMFNFVSCG